MFIIYNFVSMKYFIIFSLLIFLGNNIYAAEKSLEKMPKHRGAMMCKALVYISQKDYEKANLELNNLIN